jgi:hypothetical protein
MSNSRKANANSKAMAIAIALADVDDAAVIALTVKAAASRVKPVRVVSKVAAKRVTSVSRAKIVRRVKTVANASRVKRARIVANRASRANGARHASRVTKTPVRKAFRAVRSRRSCAAATN